MIAFATSGASSVASILADSDLHRFAARNPLHFSDGADPNGGARSAAQQDSLDPTEVLNGRRVLVVEDEAMLALDMELGLGDFGATVVGPALTLQKAIDLIEEQAANIAAAVLDVDLGGEEVFPAADRLHALGVPFVFQTGHADPVTLQDRYGNVPVLTKPTPMERLIAALAGTLNRRDV